MPTKPIAEQEEHAELTRRQLQSYVSLSHQIATLIQAVPEDATAPALRDALRQIFELVLESTVARGRDFVRAVANLGLIGPPGGAP